jgi:hypothetical protein
MNIGNINDNNITKAAPKKAKASPKEEVTTPKDQLSIGSIPEKEITFLNYMDGSNNLEPYIMQNLIDMEKVGSSENIHVAAQLSRFQIPPLTKYFFGEALKQVITSEKFTKVLEKETGDSEGVKQFQEMFKDPGEAGMVAESVLGGSPPLMQGITELITGFAGQIAEDKDMSEMLTDVAHQLAEETLDFDKETTKGATLMAGNSQGNEISRLSKHMVNAMSKFVKEKMTGGKIIYRESPYTGGSLLKAKTKEKSEGGEPEWIGSRRYHVTKGSDETKINSKVVEDMGFVNMADPKTLTDFLVWGIKNFPAKKYVVVLSDHGAGILGGFEDRGELMTLPLISKALAAAEKETGVKPDVLMFDCCLMAQTEVAYELKDRAQVMIASEETVGGAGMPYIPMLKGMNKLAAKGEATPENIAKLTIKECEKTSEDTTVTFSAIDLTKMKDLKTSIDKLAKVLMETETPQETIKFLIHNTTAYSQDSPSEPYRDYRDLGHLADNIINFKDITDPKLKEAAANIKKVLSEVIIAEEHTQENEDYAPSQGLTIYAPKSDRFVSDDVYEQYKETAMSKKGVWDEFLEQLTGMGLDEDDEDDEERKKIRKPSFIQLPQRH